MRNLCKFVLPSPSSALIVTRFILETDPDTIRRPIFLKEHCLYLFQKGCGAICYDQKTVPFSEGTLFFGFEGELVGIQADGACEYMYVSFSGPRANELFFRFHIASDNRCFTGLEGLLPFWRENLMRATDATTDLAAEITLLYTFSRLFGDDAKQSNLINRIMALTEERFTDPNLSLAIVAEELSYNPKYISHLFKKKTGTGYADYLRTRRLKHAVTLFDHGIESVKNVALLSGFSDPLYFSTLFKNTMHMTPKEYKARVQKEERA